MYALLLYYIANGLSIPCVYCPYHPGNFLTISSINNCQPLIALSYRIKSRIRNDGFDCSSSNSSRFWFTSMTAFFVSRLSCKYVAKLQDSKTKSLHKHRPDHARFSSSELLSGLLWRASEIFISLGYFTNIFGNVGCSIYSSSRSCDFNIFTCFDYRIIDSIMCSLSRCKFWTQFHLQYESNLVFFSFSLRLLSWITCYATFSCFS